MSAVLSREPPRTRTLNCASVDGKEGDADDGTQDGDANEKDKDEVVQSHIFVRGTQFDDNVFGRSLKIRRHQLLAFDEPLSTHSENDTVGVNFFHLELADVVRVRLLVPASLHADLCVDNR